MFMPRLIKLYIRNSLIGFAIAAIYVALFLWLNIANLGHLILSSDIWPVALFIFWFFNGIVFAGVQFAWVVMSMAEDEDEDEGPRGGLTVPVLVAARGGQRPSQTR